MESDEEYFVIDTDCGSDDALAIMFAINFIQCEIKCNKKLLGIICCTGNTTLDNVSRNVLLTLDIMNEHNIKVYKGSHCSLLRKYTSYEYFGEDGLGNSVSFYDAINRKAEEENGVIALISLIRKYPKKVTILCLGPLTNLALAYLMDKQFFNYVKQLHILGGNISGFGNVTPYAEFNFYYDPEAVDITLKNAVCPVTIIPWESCLNCVLPWDSYDKLTKIETKKAQFFKRITKFIAEKLLTENSQGFELVDFLVTAMYLNPNIVLETRKWTAVIDLNGHLTRGKLIVDKMNEVESGIKFITKFNEKIVFKMFEEMIR